MTMRRTVPWARPHLFGDEADFVRDALASTFISGGPYVDWFEREFAAFHGLPGHGIAVANGTAALHLALLGLGIGPGDEVIVPGWAFAAAANMTLAVGARPVFADIGENDWLVDPAAVAAAMGPRTRAIVAVHTYGNVCDIAALRAVAEPHGVPVIEDVAEALFSRRDGWLAGTLGDIACFSFHATKTITTGEGGFVLARNPTLVRGMRLVRDHGMRPERKYWHETVGHNFRLTNLQAAMGCAQFRHRDAIVAARRGLHAAYDAALADLPGVCAQAFAGTVDPVLWAYAIRLDPALAGLGRDQLMMALAGCGIETRPAFYAASQQPLYDAPSLPVAERVAASVLTLPTPTDLSAAERDHVTRAVRAAVAPTALAASA